MDKGRLEINFLIPNLELQSGKRYKPYFHNGENKMMNEWQQLIKHPGKLKDPHEPKNKSILTQSRDL
ncbi:relaxase/mobilization nuclease domain-containing protein, partial [Pseudoalteromonas sp. 24-MNA-CIBAN-0067]|uniref:relaxase/mobilization nuclease domain-containing protein n=1 Tax=Pseudoalteromonas sp. 24-MNA-CIBAN-0067 TaxID=3140423 RepID=UPI003333B859